LSYVAYDMKREHGVGNFGSVS